MTTTPAPAPDAVAPAAAATVPASVTRNASRGSRPSGDRTAVSVSDWRRPSVRWGLGTSQIVLLVLLVVVGLGPLLLLARFAVTPTQDILRTPMDIFPNGIAWSNLDTAWNDVQISRYFLNTVWLAAGSWASQLLVATTGGYLLSVLRPAYGKVVEALVLATMFIPAVVLLVPLYLTVLDPPLLRSSLINSFWAVWLPAGASAFNVLLVRRFFDSLPREVFEAARVDGAGPYRLFWSVVLPMSKPILGVVSVFAIIASWKDFLWPLLVLRDPAIQPLSVRLPSIQGTTDLGVFLAALAIATVIPIVLFLVFQRLFLSSAGLGGAVKG
ncbi:binding-protein-dependent transport systems inner membrane component [Xylanimonas cellulosilytica DSM 15894]|uniref:Binding-protein-dependent transport systems inner membrane component n=1 Tax=Xylanimonas cellulosilytica (strain DSM 15894 / JCM 12276 / CECT 5975 / KCTC 9989 / LMG 20990 / NBRC 107835 / XIL07) TaxID=446471 RepID=D1BTU2_XYLCX|nr:carbohydrate ABC transporter permease [Xylanimonas cellulosilytica]ACZ29106.1 binding-protein-dependent transport systems inner membrane component [Xylanimonas cellulosilytica DSM 15894]